MLNRSDFHEYQEHGIDYIKSNTHAFLWVEMGLGKTIMTLTAIEELIEEFEVGKCLLLAPKKVANNVWDQEVKEWSNIENTKVHIMAGSSKQRLKNVKLKRLKDINTINVDQTRWIVSYILHLEKHGIKNPFDCLIIDESSCFKTPGSTRFIAIKQIIHKFDRVILMTGTPTPNGYINLWAQMYLIDGGKSLGLTMSEYKLRFFTAVDPRGRKFVLKPGAKQEIQKLIRPSIFKLREKDYLKLPSFKLVNRKIKLPKALIKKYKTLQKEFILDFWEQEKKDNPYLTYENIKLTANFKAQLNNLLSQFANGAIYKEVGSKEFHTIHDYKLDELGRIIVENQGEPIFLSYSFISDRVRIKKRFPQAVIFDDDETIVGRWNRGEIPLLITHPASASHGLNLQKGGCICVWFGLTWNLEYFLQLNKRLHRQGQKKPVRAFVILTMGTIDEIVRAVLYAKEASQSSLMDAMSDLVKKVIRDDN